MGADRMTLKQAAEYLQTTAYKYGLPTVRKAVLAGKLPARLESAPTPYYTVLQADLMAWASNPEMHKSGRRW